MPMTVHFNFKSYVAFFLLIAYAPAHAQTIADPVARHRKVGLVLEGGGALGIDARLF